MLREIIDLCNMFDIKLDPNKSQNFLHAKHIIKREVELAKVTYDDIILDIGAGFGFLTEELASRAKKVYAIEYDRKIFSVLVYRLKHLIRSGRVIPIQGDALTVPLPKDVNKIVSNPPYHIVSPLLFRIFQEYFLQPYFSLAVMIVQWDYAKKLVAKPMEKRSRISAMAQYFADIKIVSRISRNNFFPPPQVDSALIILRPRRDRHLVPFNIFNDLLSRLFVYPNKTLHKAIKLAFPGTHSLIVKEAQKSGIDPKKRIRELDNTSLENLAKIINEIESRMAGRKTTSRVPQKSTKT